MSSVNVSTIHLEPTGNARIVANGSSIIIYHNNSTPGYSKLLSINTTAIESSFTSVPLKNYAVGDIIISANDTLDSSPNFVKCGTRLSKSAYQNVYSKISSPIPLVFDSYTSANTLTINDIVYGNGTFVAVGGNSTVGMVQTSTDGKTWTNRSITSTKQFLSVTYGAGTFVLNSNTEIKTSTDGTTWTAATRANTQAMESVNYCNDRFLIVGRNGSIQSSTNGTTWTNVTSPSVATLDKAIYGNNEYVIAGVNPTVLKSTNGTTWTDVSPVYDTSNNVISNFDGFIYGQGIYIAGQGGGQNYYYTSTNLSTWTLRYTDITNYVISLQSSSLKFFNNLFIMRTTIGIATSTDGISWINNSTYKSSFDVLSKYKANYKIDNNPSLKTLSYDSSSNTYVAATYDGNVILVSNSDAFYVPYYVTDINIQYPLYSYVGV